MLIINGFQDPIQALSLSFEGELALSATSQGELKLWDLVTGSALRSFDFPGSIIRSILLSPEGRYVLASGDIPDLNFLMSDTVTGRRKDFQGAKGQTTHLAMSRDGLVILGAQGWQALVWNVDSGEIQQVLAGHQIGITSVALSRDGALALTGDMNGKLFLWEVKTSRVIREFKGHTKNIFWLSFSPDERFILSWSQADKKLKVWETASARNIFTLSNYFGPHAMAGDGRLTVTGMVNNLRLFQVNLAAPPCIAPAMLSQIQSSEEAVSIQAAMQENLAGAGEALAAGNYLQAVGYLRQARELPGLRRSETLLHQWRELSLKLPRQRFVGGWEAAAIPQAHARSIAGLTVSRDGRQVLSMASGDMQGGMRLWETGSRNLVQTFKITTPESCCLSRNGKYVLSGDFGETLRSWEVESGQQMSALRIPGNMTRAVWISNGGRFALAGKGDGKVKGKFSELALCDLSAARVIRSFEIAEQYHCPACVSPDEQYIFSVIPDWRLVTWEMATGRQIRSLDTEVANIKDFSHIAQIFLCGDGEVAFTVTQTPVSALMTAWRWSTGEKLSSCKIPGSQNLGDKVFDVSFDGKLALSHTQMIKIHLWDLGTGTLLQSLEGHKETVTGMGFTPDSSMIVSCSLDNTLKFWTLDWELADRDQGDWDEGARPYLENFLTRQTPYAGELPRDREPAPEEISLALTRKGQPLWSEADFQCLLYELGCAGYGWLRSQGVRRQLDEMALIRAKG